MKTEEREFAVSQVTNGAAWSMGQYLTLAVEQYGIPLGQHCISLIYTIYLRLTLVNVALYLFMYVLTVILYKSIKNIYITSRERVKQKRFELEDIRLQIQIINTKLCVRDAEFTERAELVPRGAERLRRVRTHVRARVRDVIATDNALRRVLDGAACCDMDRDMHVHTTPQEDRNFIVNLLKELKCDLVAVPERQTENMECGEHGQTESNALEDSVYSSVSDLDVHQDCRVKIVKVTNVYKVAYLKHYIKKKRLCRATKQAVLKKKMESIKNLLEDWQKTLSMVINSNLTIFHMATHHTDVASQEAMGDYTKPREFSDSDSDLRNGGNDTCYDEYSLSWAQNPHRPYSYNYEDSSDTAIKEYYDTQYYGDGGYPSLINQSESNYKKYPKMFSILEEITGQTTADDSSSEGGDVLECRDLVPI